MELTGAAEAARTTETRMHEAEESHKAPEAASERGSAALNDGLGAGAPEAISKEELRGREFMLSRCIKVAEFVELAEVMDTAKYLKTTRVSEALRLLA